MYPYLKIFGAYVQAWIVFTAIGYILALIGMLSTRPTDFSLNRGKVFSSAIIYLLAGIFGAVLLNIIIHPGVGREALTAHGWEGAGVAYLGEPLLGLLAVWILSKGARFSFLDFVDLGLPYLMLSRALSRIGCLFAGCCYGLPTTLSWGFPFLADGIIRHPTQAYAMACAFAVFGSSRFIYKKLRQFKGLTFFYAIFAYSFLRFFNEFLREEGPRIVGQVKVSHPFLLLFMVVGIAGMFKVIKPQGAGQKKVIEQTFRAALLRLLIWLFCSAIFPLTIIFIANRIWM